MVMLHRYIGHADGNERIAALISRGVERTAARQEALPRSGQAGSRSAAVGDLGCARTAPLRMARREAAIPVVRPSLALANAGSRSLGAIEVVVREAEVDRVVGAPARLGRLADSAAAPGPRPRTLAEDEAGRPDVRPTEAAPAAADRAVDDSRRIRTGRDDSRPRLSRGEA